MQNARLRPGEASPAIGDERVSDYAGLTIALVCQSVPKRTSATATKG